MLTSCCDLMRSNVIINPHERFIALHMGLGMGPINYSHAPFTPLFQKSALVRYIVNRIFFMKTLTFNCSPRGVLILLNFPHFSPERTQTWSLGTTESEV